MPLVQGGPPEWIWERQAERLQWELVPSPAPNGRTDFEVRVNCGLEIMRLQFFTKEEIQDLKSVLTAALE